ncbi:hypothetical protein HRI_001455900 [Hibiscus trionum]|uniref:Uncharacterized protein n=1 Tax=Hibiscus trionum TaxID=183268 RepID=A0A9W7HI98_HIBTR|nr:hypothetical protein HRI_001455900 [Hibiscus trionum]
MIRSRGKTGNPNRVLRIYKEGVEHTQVRDKDLNFPSFFFHSHFLCQFGFLCQKRRLLTLRWRHVACHHPPPHGQRTLQPRVYCSDGGLGGFWAFRRGTVTVAIVYLWPRGGFVCRLSSADFVASFPSTWNLTHGSGVGPRHDTINVQVVATKQEESNWRYTLAANVGYFVLSATSAPTQLLNYFGPQEDWAVFQLQSPQS